MTEVVQVEVIKLFARESQGRGKSKNLGRTRVQKRAVNREGLTKTSYLSV